jgi:hypothetical protein
LLLFVLLVIVILTRVWWNLNSVLICIPLWPEILSISHVAIGHLCFFWEFSVQFVCPIYSMGCWFFARLDFKLPVYSGNWFLVTYITG